MNECGYLVSGPCNCEKARRQREEAGVPPATARARTGVEDFEGVTARDAQAAAQGRHAYLPSVQGTARGCGEAPAVRSFTRDEVVTVIRAQLARRHTSAVLTLLDLLNVFERME